MRLAGDAVEDHGGQVQVGVETLEAEDHRPGAARERARVDDERDGSPEPFRDLGRRARLAPALVAVEASHHTFHEREVGPSCVARDRFEDALARAHPPVEVVRRSPGYRGVKAGIDEVWPDLERLNGQAAPSKRGHQPKRHGCLADTAVGTGNNNGAERPSGR